MGSGASVELNEAELLAQAKSFYEQNPEQFEKLYKQVKSDVASGSIPPKSQPQQVAADATGFSTEIAEEMSLLRRDPPAYGKFVEEHLDNFQDEFIFKKKGSDTLIKTNEGKKCVEECVQALKVQTVLSEVSVSELLERAASDHQRDTSSHNLKGHDGSDGSTPQKRIERHGIWTGSCGENIDYGNESARDILIALLIDDGVPR